MYISLDDSSSIKDNPENVEGFSDADNFREIPCEGNPMDMGITDPDIEVVRNIEDSNVTTTERCYKITSPKDGDVKEYVNIATGDKGCEFDVNDSEKNNGNGGDENDDCYDHAEKSDHDGEAEKN